MFKVNKRLAAAISAFCSEFQKPVSSAKYVKLEELLANAVTELHFENNTEDAIINSELNLSISYKEIGALSRAFIINNAPRNNSMIYFDGTNHFIETDWLYQSAKDIIRSIPISILPEQTPMWKLIREVFACKVDDLLGRDNVRLYNRPRAERPSLEP